LYSYAVDATLERGEKITLLEEKAENMTMQAKQFRKSAGDVKRHFCWQYWKTISALIAYFCLFFFYHLFTFFSFFALFSCDCVDPRRNWLRVVADFQTLVVVQPDPVALETRPNLF
jgi:hypothetical protein